MAILPTATTAASFLADSELARALVSRIEARRIALSGEQATLRMRYEEVMRWVNPPWDPNSRRVDPRPERASAMNDGRPVLHTDIVGQVVNRWAALEAGSPPTFRVIPRYVPAPAPDPDPEQQARLRHMYDLDRAVVQSQASQMENQTRHWCEQNGFDRTLLWAAWAKNAFGVAILKDGWDPFEAMPTLELYENPSQVYRGWSRRYGNRKLTWVAVVDQIAPEEANLRFGLNIPIDEYGNVSWASWTATLDTGEMDQRQEQQGSNDRYVYAIEYWELVREEGAPPAVFCATVVANKLVQLQAWPWKRLPFHVLEMEHIATYANGKSVAEAAIPLNEAYDDLLDRQAAVIDFESGPRYKGLNMANSGDDVDVPGPFEMMPLREGEDIQQLDSRVDFFPSQLHANEIRESVYRVTGLTPIAWGLSPRAQTSGRALSTEWRAVELPLAGRLINLSPELVNVVRNWWDYAEAYDTDYHSLAKGYRRFKVLWEPLDVRDSTEKSLEVIQLQQANLIDPELAMEKIGIENTDEVVARIRAYMLDPVWNPLRWQQYLILRQLEVSIQMQTLQLQQAAAQTGIPGLPPPEALGEVKATAPTAQPPQPTGPATSAMNQPGQTSATNVGGAPGGSPVQTSILSQTPMEGGVGNRAIVAPGGAPGPGQPA